MTWPTSIPSLKQVHYVLVWGDKFLRPVLCISQGDKIVFALGSSSELAGFIWVGAAQSRGSGFVQAVNKYGYEEDCVVQLPVIANTMNIEWEQESGQEVGEKKEKSSNVEEVMQWGRREDEDKEGKPNPGTS